MYQLQIRTILGITAFQIFWLVAMLLSARYAMFSAFTEKASLAEHGDDVLRMWLTGLRYDFRMAGISMLPLALFGCLAAINEQSSRRFNGLAPIYLWFIALVVTATSISNFYYYQTYHNYIDVFAFGLFEDDTQAVLANTWQDYPVVKALGLSLLAAAIPAWWARRLFQKQTTMTRWSTPRFWAFFVVCIAILAVACRGSVSTFPLGRSQAQVSDLTVLNKLTPNGLVAINWAIQDHEEDIHFQAVSRKTGQDLMSTALGVDTLVGRTLPNPWLADVKPHVVMTLMESMGSNMLAFDKLPENDLLGSLRPHFAKDLVFKRFVSEDNGTAPSLAALFFNSPAPTISHSSAQNTQLPGTPFAVYKKAGYKLIWISAGNMAWRNLSGFLTKQGVDAVYDQNALMREYPEATSQLTDWGVPDEYAFKLAQKLLSETTQPLFISILTVTNHPPYVTPSHYRPTPANPTAAYKAHSEDGQIDQANILKTYQYANDSLGQFISSIKNSPLADHTLIAATGDHQMRRIKASYPREQMLDRAVPLYLYVPKPILEHTHWRFDPNRVGSHKDIMPTLYALSLSDQEYLALGGRNLLLETDDAQRAFGYNVGLWLTAAGASGVSDQPAMYRWAPGSDLLLEEKGEPATAAQVRKMKAYQELLWWQLNMRIKGYSD